MEEIKVGEYLRTKEGHIIRVDKNTVIFNLGYREQYIDMETTIYGFPYEEEIANHSKQLIDVIEIGDFVNGYRVEDVINEGPCPSGKCVHIDSSKDSSECTLWDNDIKTILTHEQYEKNCFKVGE